MQEYGLLADDDVVHRDEHQFDHEADETHDGKTHGASDGDFLEPCSDKFLSRSTENIFCQNTINNLVCIQNQHHLDSKLKPDSGQSSML
jgi:hypothetical protein